MEPWLKDALTKYPCKALDGGVFRTPPGQLSYPSLFKPTLGKNADGSPSTGKPKYSATLLFAEGTDLTVLRNAHKAAQDAKYPNFKGKLFNPFREKSEKGHISGYDDDNGIFIGARTEAKPQLRKAIGGKLVPITDEAELYPGCWVILSVHLYHFDATANKGITLGLNNVLKVRDDGPFSAVGTDAETEFAPVDLNDAAANGVNIDDLM